MGSVLKCRMHRAAVAAVCFGLLAGAGACRVQTVPDAARLIEVVESLETSPYPLLQGGSLPVSGNVVVAGSVRVTTEDFSEDIVFDNHCAHAGVVLQESDCGTALTLTQVTVRFRKLIVTPGGPPLLPGDPSGQVRLQILPPSFQECGESQFACDADRVCYETYESYCLHCLALPQADCDCRDEAGVLADGTACMVIFGDDVLAPGTCSQGTCDTAW